MGLLDYFRSSQPKGSANVAKERLQILVAHDRAARDRPSYLPKLQQEIIDVIRKYVDVDMNAVSVNYEQEDAHEVLELNIVLPEAAQQRLAP
ncbi:cell division topological specificity factor MinE [Marichromatium gracile]|uniref:Cell division topological specificity factor n=2 Tax=Marichromatium TaxID=85076 RepID=W0E246_MARPU|nr:MULTISPECIES: cell division topological specificity factor MinE [Marichromatium]MBO8085253.1 cell division topological specificity factor MinE [Marichromatium sp.]AHF03294.1 cell division topological specificity factor [Marichromatium purpuratum 984]KXX64406.1 cell division topological specificity factor [Marichromatium gracile]MBK1710718.1 cell division topological specificity factor MinE [Marichromatium gracile]MCF1181892.1 cell division topological specificity factor MinE [Marichromatium